MERGVIYRQTPVEQVRPAGQTTPHAPQFSAVLRLTSQPFAGLPSQSPVRNGHASTHRDMRHCAPIPGASRHAAPHAPQFAGLALSSVSQPLAASPSQSPKPASQTSPHRPAAHVAAEACAPVRHATPQQFPGVFEAHASTGATSTTTSGADTSLEASTPASTGSRSGAASAGGSRSTDTTSAPPSALRHTHADHTPPGPHS